MGSKVYDYLTGSVFFDAVHIKDEFRIIPEQELREELRRYRDFCLSNSADLEQEVSDRTSNLKFFSGIRNVPLSLLKQSAFYVEQHILYDPLFALTHERGDHDDAFHNLVGLPAVTFNKRRLAEVATYLKALTPMIAANYVKLLPTSYFFEPPEQLPFSHSENGFCEAVPEELLQFFRNHAKVMSVRKRDGAMIIAGSFEVGRTILILFGESIKDGIEERFGYQLLEQQVVSVNENERTIKSIMYLPDKLPNKERFDAWVSQSINQSAGHLYDRVALENTFAARFGASYLSRSSFVFDLLKQKVSVRETIQTNTANALLNLELPFLNRVDTETLMRVRTDDGEAFHMFRLELEKQLRDLRLIKDPEQLRVKAENAMHELSEVQLNQVKQKVAQLKRSILTDAAIAVGGLGAAVQSGGWSLLASALAVAKGFKSVNEYLIQKKQNPAFFLWKVLENSRKE